MNNLHLRKQMAGRAADLIKNGFVVVDLETTGLDYDPKVEIVEVAVLNHQGETLLNTLVKPVHKIPRGASRVHGIYDRDVALAPTFEQVYPQIKEVLHGQAVIAYNFTFEQNIFKALCSRHQQIAFEPTSWHCAMRAYQAYTGSEMFTSLTKACLRESVTVENAHRALGDCLMTLGLIRKMAAAAAS